MDASTRLYARLGQIPEDPNDPESLDDLIVCAFGAFERYYLCWKTKSGSFRQDGYDLPPALNEWLNPLDGTTRDWASLQVVFGRGEEYFASDKNGKVEYKEPEVKRSTEEEETERVDRQALRRSRTVSFLRPLSQASNRSDGAPIDAPVVNRRTSSISSQRISRPPSLSYSTTGSEASTAPSSEAQPQTQEPGAAFQISQQQSSTETTSRFDFPAIPEEALDRKNITKLATPEGCTCGCHDPPLPHTKRPQYANASVQTEPMSPPLPRTSLRVDTFSASNWGNHNYSAIASDARTPMFDGFGAVPFSMGRMTNYFSKPGYQLGDSLASGYHYYEQPVYQYQDRFGDEALQ